MQRMGVENTVLNRNKNCSWEAATPVSEEPAFWEAQVSPAEAGGLSEGAQGFPHHLQPSPRRLRSPLPMGLGLRLSQLWVCVRNVSSPSRAGEATSLRQLCGWAEATYWGPSTPVAKLRALSQTRMGYPEGFTAMGETTHPPVSFATEPGRWQVSPFWPPALEAAHGRLRLPGAPLLLRRNAPLHVSPRASTRNPSVPRRSHHLSPSLPPGPSSFPRAALFSPPSTPAAEGVRGIKGQELSETETELLLRNPGGAAISAGENVLCSKAICIAACCNTFVCIVPLLFSGV